MGIDLRYKKGQTPINEEEKSGLLIKTITLQEELDEFEQMNIEKAVEWVIYTKLSQERILSEKFVKDLHKKMYDDVWKWAGSFRKSEKNIGISWPHISTELKKIMDDTQYWVNNQTYSPEEIAIRFKHRIVQIHCFPNGNGRHSRLMADIIITSIFDKEIFSWCKSNMVKADETRSKYITSLKEADNGNIAPLIAFALT
jgi:Fic-DOC domain mobile mystery protein B